MRFLVTAGPTQEPIDPVRYIGNRSSGRMGYAVAEAAIQAGHSVCLVSGRVNLQPPAGATVISVLTSDEMFDAVMEHTAHCDALVMCAAVADYRPGEFSKQKIKKQSGCLSLQLVRTRDILASLPRHRKFVVVGFAAETNNVEKNAQKKLREKNLDMVVANDVSRADSGMESADNEVTIFFPNDKPKHIARTSKKIIAHELVKIISKLKKTV